MALNPPTNSEGQPMRVEGEYFAVLRKNIEIEVKIEGLAKLTAKGKVQKSIFIRPSNNLSSLSQQPDSSLSTKNTVKTLSNPLICL